MMTEDKLEWLNNPLTKALLEHLKQIRGDALMSLEEVAANGNGSLPQVEAVACCRWACAAYMCRRILDGITEGWR
jgi:hypothetical protein